MIEHPDIVKEKDWTPDHVRGDGLGGASLIPLCSLCPLWLLEILKLDTRIKSAHDEGGLFVTPLMTSEAVLV